MTTDYRPITCEEYAELEAAILQGALLRIGWRDQDGLIHVSSLMPLDLRTRRSEEFLVAGAPDRTRLEIRLDRIRRFVPL